MGEIVTRVFKASNDSPKEVSDNCQGISRRVILASVIGNGLEWYDYMLYGFFALFIAQAFFPDDDPFIQTLLTFLTFSFAFLFRPLGGILLGIYSDRYGRKPALVAMIVMMGIATVLMGITPTYASWGLLATLLIIIARILQGISVGGEFGGATTMLAEYAPKDRHYFYASFQTFAQALATLLAAGLGLSMVLLLGDEDAATWGWRVLFLLGGIIAPVGFYIRSRIPETPAFSEMKASGALAKTPLRTVLKKHRKAIVAGLGIVAIGGAANYVWFVYMTFYVVHTLELPVQAIFLSDTIAGVILMVGILLVGNVADRIGGIKIFVVGTLLFGLSAYPLFAYVLADPTYSRLIIGQAIGCLFLSLVWAPTPGIFARLFSADVRATGMSFTYNLGVIVFGAMAPPLLTILGEVTGSKFIPAFYLLFCAMLSLLLMYLCRSVVDERSL